MGMDKVLNSLSKVLVEEDYIKNHISNILKIYSGQNSLQISLSEIAKDFEENNIKYAVIGGLPSVNIMFFVTPRT